MRSLGCGLDSREIAAESIERLWLVHESALNSWRRNQVIECASGELSILDLKCELSCRLLRRCVLCARRCGVDRTAGAQGFCRLSTEAVLAESFIHIGEEPPINPSHLFSLAGCALRCRFCQQSALLSPCTSSHTPLTPTAWGEIDAARARSVSFIGGNPDESAAAILKFLDSAPADFSLPIVWNSHAYSSPEVILLLDGIVDAYIPDLKYGSDACAKAWSEVDGYFLAARRTIIAMTEQHVPVIVRILLLPGHLNCCHIPALEFLAKMPLPPLVSLRGQYSPAWQIGAGDDQMASRIPVEEVDRAYSVARALGLSLIK
jgi:putative pyruvate formate lyase activating enzyme